VLVPGVVACGCVCVCVCVYLCDCVSDGREEVRGGKCKGQEEKNPLKWRGGLHVRVCVCMCVCVCMYVCVYVPNSNTSIWASVDTCRA
jgi:hypothetical protein